MSTTTSIMTGPDSPSSPAPGPVLLLGIDTGGTYTDAVVYDEHSHTVVASAKSPTTHHDLSIGIRGAIDGALAAAGVDAAPNRAGLAVDDLGDQRVGRGNRPAGVRGHHRVRRRGRRTRRAGRSGGLGPGDLPSRWPRLARCTHGRARPGCARSAHRRGRRQRGCVRRDRAVQRAQSRARGRRQRADQTADRKAGQLQPPPVGPSERPEACRDRGAERSPDRDHRRTGRAPPSARWPSAVCTHR